MNPFTGLKILGIAQDAGLPQVGCYCSQCQVARSNPSLRRHAAALALVDGANDKWHLFEATPDLPSQLDMMHLSFPHLGLMESIFLTHAHIGHYTGLMYLGREAIASRNVTVYAGERMEEVLCQGAPWSQLVNLGNIELHRLTPATPVELTHNLSVTPMLVPHRNEYSETFGFIISGPQKKALFIPDIDRWEGASFNIAELAAEMDYCFLDATFFSAAELPGRNLTEIPHPLVTHSMDLLQSVVDEKRSEVFFIHLNHSNPLHTADSWAYKEVIRRGFGVAWEGQDVEL